MKCEIWIENQLFSWVIKPKQTKNNSLLWIFFRERKGIIFSWKCSLESQAFWYLTKWFFGKSPGMWHEKKSKIEEKCAFYNSLLLFLNKKMLNNSYSLQTRLGIKHKISNVKHSKSVIYSILKDRGFFLLIMTDPINDY